MIVAVSTANFAPRKSPASAGKVTLRCRRATVRRRAANPVVAVGASRAPALCAGMAHSVPIDYLGEEISPAHHSPGRVAEGGSR